MTIEPQTPTPLGPVGARVSLIASVIYVKAYRNQWGLTYLTILRDQSDRGVKTLYSGRQWKPERGQQVEITATVECAASFADEPVTEVTRAHVTVKGVAPGFKRTEPTREPGLHESRWSKSVAAQARLYRGGYAP